MRVTTVIVCYSLVLLLTVSLVDLRRFGSRPGLGLGFWFDPKRDMRNSLYKCFKNGLRCLHDIECCSFMCAFNEKTKIGICRNPTKGGGTNSTRGDDDDSEGD
ncbi:unnamed protein product [Allacma fusca]|uniref:Uncharacterized protein n=1 Tax=Allacma fusca TaxID=39272 RepID=A0A8J2MCI3_9HEXA|nr:unnamed protein product [Allacma fusca]